jgi:hypothetical protein
MATDYQALLDMLKPKEEEQLMSLPPQANELAEIPAAQPEPKAPMIPDNTPQEQVFSTPQLADVLPPKPEQPQVPMMAEADIPEAPQMPMSRSEALLEEYRKMMDKGEGDLKSARKRDRMLKAGGAIGDALATVLNARSQMNVKAPGVQVQQGAGLGKIADMFATAPEVASDVKARREDLLKQYAELARGERAGMDRELAERRIRAYEDQVKAQAKKLERDATKETATKETQPSFEEKEKIKASVKEEVQVAKENRQIKEKLESAIPTVDEQIKNVKTALNLINKSKFAGTGPLDQYFAGATPEGQLLKKALRNIQLDTLVTKFQGMSRAVDTETDRKFFQETQPDMGNFETTNKKMLSDILERLEGIKERSQNKLKEITSQKEGKSQPVETQQQKTTNLVKIKGPSGQEATMTEEKAQKYLSKPGYTRVE